MGQGLMPLISDDLLIQHLDISEAEVANILFDLILAKVGCRFDWITKAFTNNDIYLG